MRKIIDLCQRDTVIRLTFACCVFLCCVACTLLLYLPCLPFTFILLWLLSLLHWLIVLWLLNWLAFFSRTGSQIRLLLNTPNLNTLPPATEDLFCWVSVVYDDPLMIDFGVFVLLLYSDVVAGGCFSLLCACCESVGGSHRCSSSAAYGNTGVGTCIACAFTHWLF